ncbi:ras guanine nucleotide exchange factor domain-containing protein [Schizothecium vesticola]|uniref:Ras guanine nucleotide exchange factor domain-containing protein n=1 Tax=Schizothecium vesticola TaxID=314040 RepID=A0AA40EKD1_9PEZI|nr:ras guanine nucleotide exchange factor domain-containing protein [Schizothecium vesticola]
MRVQAHQSSDRSARAALLPASSSAAVPASPSASPFPRQPGSAFYSDPAPRPKPRSRTSVLVSKGGSFLFVDEKPTSLPQTAAPPTNPRDSITSTGSEPFYLDFNVPIPNPVPVPIQIAPIGDQRNDLRQQPWPPPRKESLSGNNPTPWFDYANTNMENINIAVIGAIGVGKSSFVQRVLRSPRPPNHNVTAFRQEIDGALQIVTLVELDLEVFEVNPNQPIQWPKQIGGHMEPRMDGALMLYDVTNKESIRDLKSTLAALSLSGLPTVLVATKWDAPEELRQLDPAGMATAFPTCAAYYKLSPNSPGSTRECLQTMVRAAMAARRDKAEGSAQRRRAASTANLDAPSDNHSSRPLSQHSKHSRASSDLSLLRGFPPPPTPEGGYYRAQAARSPRLDYQTPTPYSVPTLDVPPDGPSQTVSSMLRTPGIRLDGGTESFLDIDESDADSYRYSDDIPILQRNDDVFGDRPVKVTGVTFDELVDRLLAAKMTRSDNNFNDVFLCLYRKFAAPGELFTGIMSRFISVREDRTAQFLVKTEVQMRIVEVIAKWVSTYPGDFARPQTKRKLQDLIKQLSTDPVFSTAAHQMRLYLSRVVEDDDTGWAKSDSRDDEARAFDYKANTDAGRRQSEFAESMSSVQLTPEEAAGMAHPGRPSQSSEFSGSDVHSRVPARFQFHQYEDYEREAATLVPGATVPMDKMRYHIFMEIDPDTLAEEITRIDWIMFSSIKIRDLVRHVSLPAEQKERCRSLKNVNRMVSHFNHVAKWVTQMVLIRDKAKHRAPCLEKFMVIAHRLRQLNNYNGLAAVLAGINGTAIHRLAQTRALVSADVQKRFARLVLLMGTQKSHFAYRLAWENSPVPRIPFIPLHRRDLVSAEEGSRTFVGPNGDRINWKKFEILGEVLLPIMKSQGQPYPNLQRHDMSRELVLDCKMSADDEEIYQRSLQVEPTSGAGSESKKKFPWLPK